MLWKEQNIRRLFEVSLIFKGIFALFEILGGIAIYFISDKWFLQWVYDFAQAEIVEHPQNFIANHLLHWVANYSVSSKLFAAFYLFSHGVVKLWLVIGLFQQKLWYYPAAIVIFGLFIVYQLYRITFTNSLMLVLITILDVAIIILTWHEYRYLRKENFKS